MDRFTPKIKQISLPPEPKLKTKRFLFTPPLQHPLNVANSYFLQILFPQIHAPGWKDR